MGIYKFYTLLHRSNINFETECINNCVAHGAVHSNGSTRLAHFLNTSANSSTMLILFLDKFVNFAFCVHFVVFRFDVAENVLEHYQRRGTNLLEFHVVKNFILSHKMILRIIIQRFILKI